MKQASTADGTGLVHTSPGHGRDDYEVVRRAGFKVDDPALCPVDEGGYYDANAPEAFRGKRVVTPKTPADDANAAVLEALEAGDPSGALLLSKKTLSHSYPHCWRCRNPVIFRATNQWFIDLHAIREKALAEIHGRVNWVPPFGANRIGAMVENRLEWTISRQRRWGSPITFLRCTDCKARGLISHFPSVGGDVSEPEKREREDFFERVRETFREHGADAWYDDSFPPSYFLSKSSSSSSSLPSACSRCGGTNFEKLKDILDVWFDSGVSHQAVLRSGDYGLANPYTAVPPTPVVYLEGHDQHRGWFQSSLLTSVALTDRAPFDTVVTHGFVVDGAGKKMSKSVGNTIAPQDIIKRDGADVLRLFIASADFTDDVRMSKEIFDGTANAYRKIRNTARFLLSNLFDFDPSKDAVPYDRLEPLDRWILDAAAGLVEEARNAYEAYAFHTVARRLLEFTTTDLSAFWCDVRKDAFYVLASDDPARRSAQTAAFRIAGAIALLLSPICPFTAEEIFESIPGNAVDGSSVFLMSLSELELLKISANEQIAWGRVLALRADFLQALEPLRRDGRVGSAGQATAVIGPEAVLDEALRTLSLSEEKLAEVLGTPSVAREGEAGSLSARAARGAKCPRCWQVRSDVEPGDDGICSRCRRVVGE